MSNSRRLTLPLVFDKRPGFEPLGPPSVVAAREKLGGRVGESYGDGTGSDIGRFVSLDDGRLVGVVVFSSAREKDVWLENGIVRRTRPEAAQGFAGDPPPNLYSIASDLHVFARLSEGDRIRYEHDGMMADGWLIEKCRYGALVLSADERIFAVGFRKLWPAYSANLGNA